MKKIQNVIYSCLAAMAGSSAFAVPVDYPLANPSFESPALDINNTWYGGVSSWGYTGSLGTTFSAPYVSGYPAPNGSQFLYGAADDWHIFQQTGTIQANTRYWMQVSLYPLTSGTNRADIVIEETDSYAATFAVAYHQPTWDPSRKDFQLPAGQWTTVTIGFNSAEWASMVGHNFRIRIHGYNLAVDNARLIVDNEIHSFHIANNGNDSTNSGMSSASPWQTFNNLGAWLPLSPGERVLLERGSTFSQELYLWGKGTAAAPIELAAYGTGNNPIISRGDTVNGICVLWDSPSYVRINQIDCRNSKLGIYLRYDNDPNNYDVRIDGCNFKDMPDATLEPANHNYEFAYSDAIFLGGHDWISNPSTNTYYTFLDGLRITNCVAENCAHGFGTGWYYPAMYRSRLKNLIMEDNLASNCLNGWTSLIGVDGGHMKRCHSVGGGGKDTWAGTTLGMIQSSQNFLIQDCEFSYCDRAQAGDGSGMDFEGNTINVTFDNNTVHDNDASALLILSTEGPHQNLVISNNVFYNNARDPWNSEINSEIQGSQAAHTGCSIINNGIYRGATNINYLSPSSNWSGFTISGNRQFNASTYLNRPRWWNFDTTGNLEGWSGFNQWSSNTVSGGNLWGLSTGNDPFAHSAATFSNLTLNPYAWVRMKQTAGTVAQVFYITETDSVWNESKSAFFPIIPDNQYHDYFVDLDQPGIQGVITQVRLDPTIVANSTMAIDFVRLTNSTDPNQPAPPAAPPASTEVSFTSIASEDGYALESARNSGIGGSLNSSATTIRIGDDTSNRAYRPILSFDTSSLPDNAIIDEATISITRVGSITGSIPIGTPNMTFGELLVDVMTGPFSGSNTLQNGDWQAAASKSVASKFAWPAYIDTMTINSRLESPDLTRVNKTGRTQYRIRYEIDDDNDNKADYVSYASSNHATVAYRPKLKVKYTVP
jgi:hypothetical protein